MNSFRTLTAVAAIAVLFTIVSCKNQNSGSQVCCESEKVCDISGTADKIVTGNIITADPHRMRAEAMTIKNGMVQYVGSKEIAESLCDDSTVREDYGEACVYPGFIDVHVHPQMAGQRQMESINLIPGESVDDYLAIVKAFVEQHPEMNTYKGAGWSPRDRELLATDLDAICKDKPVILNSFDGHSYWLNSLALEKFGFTPEVAREDGPAQIHVDAEGRPSGVVVEESERIAANDIPELADEKKALMLWQDFAFKIGFTTVGDAGFSSDVDLQAYRELEDEGKFKLLTYCSYYQPVPDMTVEDRINNTIAAREKYNGRYFKVSGVKMFVDGVVEGHTAWLIDDYLDQPGYNGVKKLDDHDYLVNLVKSANENGFYVHIHTIGDGAVKFAVDAIEEAQRQTGIFNARNCLAHLQIVRPEDIKRMADNNIIPVVAPLWTPYFDNVTELEFAYLGEQRATDAYPIRSFLDAGAVITFHSDYPVSASVSIPKSIVFAVTRGQLGQPSRQREKEGLTRLEALQAMTVNAAFALGDDTIGSLESGKKANYVVFDSDFLTDPDEKVMASSTLATAVEGEIVYSAR